MEPSQEQPPCIRLPSVAQSLATTLIAGALGIAATITLPPGGTLRAVVIPLAIVTILVFGILGLIVQAAKVERMLRGRDRR